MSRLLPLVLLLAGCECGRPTIFDCTKDDCESCDVLAAKLSFSTGELQLCRQCQGAAEGTTGCQGIPVRDGKHVMRGCNVDGDCNGISRYCGHYAGTPHNTCVEQDPI
ncbi:MAG: hypothetical protein ACOZQL_42850 [Myxococcota bacterium]